MGRWEFGRIDLVVRQHGGTVEHPKSKSTKPRSQAIWDTLYCIAPTFDRAVLFLDLDDPGRPWLARGLQGDAGLVQALLPEVVGAALGASPALRFIRAAALIPIQGSTSHYTFIRSFILSRHSPRLPDGKI